MLPGFRSLALCAAVAGSAFAQAAVAADYDPPIFAEEAPEYTPVEVGSGWYLRGDIGYNFETDYKNGSYSYSDEFDVFDRFNPLEQVSFSEDEKPFVGSVGMGYHFNDFFRVGANLGWLSGSDFEGTGVVPGGCEGTSVTGGVSTAAISDCRAEFNVENEAWTGLLNAYVDLGTFVGITPYVGAGAGVIYTRSSADASAYCAADETTTGGVTTTFLCDGQANANSPDVEYVGEEIKNRDYNFMYSLSAGLAYRVSTNASIDLGYQFMSAPDAQYLTLGDDGVQVNEGIDIHQVKVGLRYDLW